jgi:hypothetical protein
MEAPGFNLSYSNGAFQFRKDRTLLPQIVPHASGFEVRRCGAMSFSAEAGRSASRAATSRPG